MMVCWRHSYSPYSISPLHLTCMFVTINGSHSEYPVLCSACSNRYSTLRLKLFFCLLAFFCNFSFHILGIMHSICLSMCALFQPACPAVPRILLQVTGLHLKTKKICQIVFVGYIFYVFFIHSFYNGHSG